ncbi:MULTISPECIES: nitrogenase-stabilizing/protective protein NifW [unclassified Paraburkholderia]|uniref:nitrogenase-stabilizing/protective protein NifW n=1 Tax=unclassified Paraburkholderia TaxID=2615204 RepID=UPI001797BB05|nr:MULTISPECIES: nitrogenase-stabilizing/protective protein NifW [unclassified Paraburkholderia]MBB5411236.1 nitrogenase-stabilizing/protective protein [Paraburkholderia sp. HC6.4b]MBB5454008.1 nitrogenase-stabilizing/protective protein [Paraburkholderia sp. Kb1A]
MQEVIEQLRHLSPAEDFLRFFDIAFGDKVVNVSRLHILKRFFQNIEQQKELPRNNATAVLAVYRCLLQKAYNDFAVSTPAEQKVFKASSLRDVSLKLVHKIFARHPTLEADLLMKRAP